MCVVVQDSDVNKLFKIEENEKFEFTANGDTKINATVYAEKAGDSYIVSFDK